MCPQALCLKCSLTACFQCLEGYFIDETHNCTSCSIKLMNCNICSSNGSQCLNCSEFNNVDPNPIDGKCNCKEGFYLNNGTCESCK